MCFSLPVSQPFTTFFWLFQHSSPVLVLRVCPGVALGKEGSYKSACARAAYVWLLDMSAWLYTHTEFWFPNVHTTSENQKDFNI